MRTTFVSLFAALVSVAVTNAVRAGPITFVNDYEGFLAAAGDVQTIDFETLPDGSTPVYVVEHAITPEFNYTDQGVSFSSSEPRLFVHGTPSIGYDLIASSYPDVGAQDWIIADLVTPTWAVGVFFPGTSYFYAYDADDQLITSIAGGGGGIDHFLGIVSDVPIGRTIIGSSSWHSIADSFHFTPIPEPASLLLLAVGGSILLRGCRRSC